MKIEADRELFRRICYEMTVTGHERYNIGTYKEKKLHLILKKYYAESSGSSSAKQEAKILGHIADVITEKEIIEIQTGNFGKMKSKLESFLPETPVNIVYPVAETKWISWIDPATGDVYPKHKSPKKGTPLELLPEMVYIRPYIRRENIIFSVVMLEIEEYRYLNGWSRDKKKGSQRYERIPVDISSVFRLETKEDFRELIPSSDVLPEVFTIKEFMRASKMSYASSQRCTKILTELGVLEKAGKRSRSDLFVRVV